MWESRGRNLGVLRQFACLCRELLVTADEGTIGLDWAPPSKGTQGAPQKREGAGITCEEGVSYCCAARVSADTTPIVVIVPGLTSHSQSQVRTPPASCLFT